MTEDVRSRAARTADKIRAGDQIALGRALTQVEAGGSLGAALLDALRSDMGQARVVGFTGPPGSGKSTLVGALIREWRAAGQRIAVLAVDPVSPISGGAVLGDRTRMGAHTLDDGVFIRSVSARGRLGGLSGAAQEMADLLDAAGWPLILIETVGAGQSETEIAQVADLTVVISAPGLGDELQAIKAGILEIANVLVVGKADRADAEQAAKALEGMLSLRSGAARNVPVLRVSATSGAGVAELRAALDSRLDGGAPDRARRRRERKLAVLTEQFAERMRAALAEGDGDEDAEAEIEAAAHKTLAAMTQRQD